MGRRGVWLQRIGLRGTACVLLCAALCVTTGCLGPEYPKIEGEAEFQQVVLEADRPALVDFYKGGCPTCGLAEGTLNQLADEYGDRVVFAGFEVMTAAFQVPSPAIKVRYDIRFFPTVILFVDGQEYKRWILEYGIDNYRKVLDEVLAGPAATAESSSSGP